MTRNLPGAVRFDIGSTLILATLAWVSSSTARIRAHEAAPTQRAGPTQKPASTQTPTRKAAPTQKTSPTTGDVERQRERYRLRLRFEELRAEEKFREAAEVGHQVLELEREVRGTTGATEDGFRDLVEALAGLHENLDDFETAASLIEELVAIEAERHGKNHWRVTDRRIGLEKAKQLGRMSEEERELAREAVERKRQASEEEKDGAIGKTRELLEDALKALEKLPGKLETARAHTEHDLAVLYVQIGRYDEARVLFEKALSTRKRLFGEGHPGVAKTLYALAELDRTEGRYREALSLSRSALATRRAARGAEHQDVVESLDQLAALYKLTDQHALAEPLLEESLEVKRRLHGREHRDYVEGLKQLAGLRYIQGDIPRADALSAEAAELLATFETRDRLFAELGISRIQVRTPADLKVVVLVPENQTGSPDLSHWRFGLRDYLSSRLRVVSTVEIPPVSLGLRQLKLDATHPLTTEEARKLGQFVEARRAIRGSYRKGESGWQVTLRVLNVVDGSESTELRASSSDWPALVNELLVKLLVELRVDPSADDWWALGNFGRFRTRSGAARDWFVRATALSEEGASQKEIEACIRRAIHEDPDIAVAHIWLGGILATQGRFEEAEESARTVLKLQPGNPRAHTILGVIRGLQKRFSESESELGAALRSAPGFTGAFERLGELYTVQEKLDEAVVCLEEAIRIAPMSAEFHASVGFIHARRKNREKALQAAKEAERLDPESINVQQKLTLTYELLGEAPTALAHYETFLELTRGQTMNPKVLAALESKMKRLQATLTPKPVDATLPRKYSPEELRAELEKRLTKEELERVVDPLESSPDMKQWALELTAGASSDLDRARAIFQGLRRHIQTRSAAGKRTAREVFAVWSDPHEEFSCQEYGKLFVALARDVGLRAFFVHLDRDHAGQFVSHDCAAVFVDDKCFLVDPAYHWFGVPHRESMVLDDLQAIAHHFFQGGEAPVLDLVWRFRLAEKLHPDFAWGKLNLVTAYRKLELSERAWEKLKEARELAPDSWRVHYLEGLLVADEDRFEDAERLLRRALELNPHSGDCLFALGLTLYELGRHREARDTLEECLRNHPRPDFADEARGRITYIDEILASE